MGFNKYSDTASMHSRDQDDDLSDFDDELSKFDGPLLPYNVKDSKLQTLNSSIKRFFSLKTLLAVFGALLFIHKITVIYHNSVQYSNSVSEETLSSEYLNVLETSNFAANWSYEFTKAPHLAGTNLDLVHWQEDKYREFGLENVYTESFDVYINYPVENSLKLVAANSENVVYQPTLTEDKLDEDPTTNGDDLVPAFHGYSANGNATAEFIYANYGTKEDFELLAHHGVNVTGKIAIVRYGKLFRGLKVKFAQEAGAIGVLIYSEPSDDGEISVDNGYKAYPEGPARNPSSLQRGSVQFLSQIPGDPTTPGWPSKGDNVHRVDPYHSIPKIPSLPISYKEVQPILAQLNGHGLKIGNGWEGSLHNVSYNVGPNPNLKLNLYNNQKYNISKLWNVYGEIEGINKNEIVLLGNHRDAWIKGGAGDPNSGSAVTLEIIRALNELKTKYNWKPKRTIKFASWDGEEYGLLGSTEFGELHHKELQKKVVAYLNLDDAVAGSVLNLEASPLLNKALNKAATKVQYPRKEKGVKSENVTLYDHFYKQHHKKIGILGSGSDFTVFLEHLGIPSVNVVFETGPTDPIYHYHSNYDSYYWMEKFCDPGFVLHNTMAKYFGLVALDIADSKVLDFGLVENSVEISGYFNESVKNIPDSWFNEQISSKPSYDKMVASSDKEYMEWWKLQITEGIQSLGEKTLRNEYKSSKGIEDLINKTRASIENFIKASEGLEQQIQKTEEAYEYYDTHYWRYNPYAMFKKESLARDITRINKKLKYLERFFLNYGGLHHRFWFRHIIFAVDRNNGYSAISLPGLNEGIVDKNVGEVYKWLAILNGAIRNAAYSIS